jgi:hypothetical protein
MKVIRHFIFIHQPQKGGPVQSNILIADLIKYNTGFLVKSLNGIDKTRLFIRPNYELNPIIWIFGHIIVCRGELIDIMGTAAGTVEYNEYFASGTFPRTDPADYPHFDELMALHEKLGAQLAELLISGGEQILSQRAWNKYETVGKHVVGEYIHESYHIGEIKYILRLTNKIGSSSTSLGAGGKKKNSTGKVFLDNLKSVVTVK